VTLENLRRQLAREAREYLADLRDIRESLKFLEGWIVLALFLAAILMLVAWTLVTLGFNPPNEHISKAMYNFGLHSCRPISNLNGIIVIVDTLLLVFLMAVTVGSVLNQMARVRSGQPRNANEVIYFLSLLLIVGVGGIVYMHWIC